MIRNRWKIRAALVYSLYILALALLQVTLPPQAGILGSQPDLTLVLAILCGCMFGAKDGLIVGLAAGFLRDMLAGRALGLGMLVLMYSALLASVIFRKFFRRNILLGLAQIILITVFYEFLITGLNYIAPMLSDVQPSFEVLFRQMIKSLPGQLLANLAAGAPLIFLLHFAGPYHRGSRKDDSEDSIVGDSIWRVS